MADLTCHICQRPHSEWIPVQKRDGSSEVYCHGIATLNPNSKGLLCCHCMHKIHLWVQRDNDLQAVEEGLPFTRVLHEWLKPGQPIHG